MITLLQKHWQNLTPTTPIATSIFEQIIVHYQEPQRHYHNLTHISNLLILWEQYQRQLQDADTVAYSIFFHDIIYNPTKNDNEEQSAVLAQEYLRELGCSDAQISKVTAYILATKKHPSSTTPTDLQWFLEFDLSILGTELTTYQTYAQQIRQEYQHVPEWQYKIGRRKVLHNFLAQNQLFYCLPNHYNQNAKENLSWELEKLKFLGLF
jgi:predicted metal-dependent HD superfamily phosphohydrolase